MGTLERVAEVNCGYHFCRRTSPGGVVDGRRERSQADFGSGSVWFCGAANRGRSRLLGGQSRLKAGCGQNCPPHKTKLARCTSDAAEFGDGFTDGVELLDERDHAVFGVVEFLRLLQNFGGVRARDHGDAILIGHHDVVGIHARAGAGDRNVGAREAVMIDGRGGHDAAAEHRKLEALDLRQVAHGGVHHGAGEAAVFHGGGHEAADARDIQAVFEHDDVDRAGRRGIDSVEHALGGGGAFVVLVLLQQHGDGGTGELGREDGPHVVRHVDALAVELFGGVGHGGDFDEAEAFDERVGGGLGGEPSGGAEGQRGGGGEEQEAEFHGGNVARFGGRAGRVTVGMSFLFGQQVPIV
jgi:hypothetical protein